MGVLGLVFRFCTPDFKQTGVQNSRISQKTPYLEDLKRIQTGKAGKKGTKIRLSLKNARDDS
jgi:hypothetical protein